jgi:type VI secretion system protein ImpK
MPNDDDFNPFDSDKTVILPTPGGAAKPTASPSFADSNNQFGGSQQSNQLSEVKLPKLAHIAAAEENSTLGNSLAAICYAAQLRHLSTPPDTSRLFNEFVIQIKEIGENLKSAGQADEIIVTSRYLICSFIDEMILNTPWGSTSHWSTQSLLSFFHKESQGGEKFFDILKKIEQQSGRYLDLIELVYVCLSFGYLGKYRLQADGASQISSIQENLYQHIRKLRQHKELTLSKTSQGIDTSPSALTQGKALVLTAIVAVVILIASYGTLLFNLNDKSEPVAMQALDLQTKMPALIEKPRAKPTNTNYDLQALLETLTTDLQNGLIDIKKIDGGIKFILFGQGLFNSGSAQVANITLVNRISAVIQQIKGPLKVVGHSDDIPIRTIEFPSNLQLSKKRAAAIARVIRGSNIDRAIKIEGLADLQPILPNTNAANRAKNRRVEILLFSN